MPYTTEQKKKIYTWLESKKPANFDASQYYKYFVNSLYFIFWSWTLLYSPCNLFIYKFRK